MSGKLNSIDRSEKCAARRAGGTICRAIHDPLTGPLNHGFFDTLFSVESDRARRYGQQTAVAILAVPEKPEYGIKIAGAGFVDHGIAIELALLAEARPGAIPLR